jgi:voltage-gated potassium channel Kch
MLALSLCQVGEFAFVLLAFGQKSGAIPVEVGAPLVAATAVTMLLTPLAFVLLERVVLPRVTEKGAERKHDEVSHDDASVVVAGFGRVGQVVVRLLRTWGHGVTVLDLDPEMVELLRRLGQRVYYGDASRLDLLTAAGCAKAKLFVLAIDEPEKSLQVADLVRRNFPNLPIVARARNRAHAYQLRRRGIRVVVRETMGSSLELGAAAMVALGARAHSAHRYAERWRAHDEANFEKLLPVFGDDAFFGEAKRALEGAEQAMREEFNEVNARSGEEGWDNEGLRDGARASK